ncbi:GK12566 gene product from transcript GK12566-RA [Fibrisoma limi BUZ 3]|uniref:GK12566 gene product from transcript GK12566-RA n=1 Tax=Fibrisoma limi BUZ 3 TaxID=1185876 RepID=I2GKS0_9BACT|nr:GK12566 gene product from transcript GK12566-RA [Fibrisoma limi]CCH54496.1 GK12566 gene product from transcript GK12566-RA [Fibrisoma limi BUZ 3]
MKQFLSIIALLISLTASAQVTIQPTPFWVKVYRGYPTATYKMTLPASLSATVVTTVLYYGEGKLALPAPAQPTLNRTDNDVTITYPNVALLPTTSYQVIKFDGVIGLVGPLTTSFAFAGIPQNQSTTITLSGGTTVTVSVLGSGGGVSSGISSFTALTDRPTTLSGYNITNAYTQTQINSLLSVKANTATTLSGYGIGDAYTQSQVNTLLSGKATTATTLSGYGITNAYTKTEVDNALSGKVSVVSGKGLSTEDYTTAEKTKLAGLSNFNLTLTTTGSSGPATYSGGVLNIPQYAGGGGGGDMFKATYDSDSDNVVDQAETAPWSGVSGKPSTFSPSAHSHAQSEVTGLADSLSVRAFKWQLSGYKPSSYVPAWSEITGKPSFASVATSGAYTDLSGRPSIGTAAALNVAATGNAATGEVVKGNDTRLTDSRTPTAHTQTASTITDFQATVSANTDVSANTSARHTHSNKTLLDTYDQSNANLSDAVTKRHSHSNQSVLDNTTASFTTADESKVDALGTASTKNVPASGNAAAGEVVLGSDTRLTDARTPTTHTHLIGDVTGLQTALDGKQNMITLTTTGTSGAATLTGNTLNIPNYATGGGSATLTRTAVTGNYTALTSDQVLEVNTGATSTTLTLPTASGVSGKQYFINRYASDVTGLITIASASGVQGPEGLLTLTVGNTGTSSFTIANNTYTLPTDWKQVSFYSNGTEWRLLDYQVNYLRNSQTKKRVLVVGSSSANGAGASVGTGSSATAPLDRNGWAQQLGQRWSATHTFINRATDGGTTTTILQNLESYLVRDRPDYVLVALTLGNEWSEVSNRPTGYLQFMTNYAKIASIVRAYGAIPVLVTSQGRNTFNATDYNYLQNHSRQISDISGTLVLDHGGMLDNGAGQYPASINAGDGIHYAFPTHTHLADQTPKSYFEGAPGDVPSFLPAGTGTRITSSAAVQPLQLDYGYKSFCLTFDLRRESGAAASTVVASFSTTSNANFRVDVLSDYRLQISMDNGSGGTTALVTSTAVVGTSYQTVSVRYNALQNQIALYINGVKEGQSTSVGNGWTIDRIILGGRITTGVNAVDYWFRNALVHTTAPLDQTVLDGHRGRVNRGSLLLLSTFSEGQPPFSGFRFSNQTGLPFRFVNNQ